MKLNIKVIPNAKQNKLVDEAGRVKVYLTAPPVDGKANKALIEFLAEHFHVKKSAIRIVRGEKGREKVVEVGKRAWMPENSLCFLNNDRI